jgi:hypothetical protein
MPRLRLVILAALIGAAPLTVGDDANAACPSIAPRGLISPRSLKPPIRAADISPDIQRGREPISTWSGLHEGRRSIQKLRH